MNIYNNDREFWECVTDKFALEDLETDSKGEIVIYTRLFKWLDGTIRDEQDPALDD